MTSKVKDTKFLFGEDQTPEGMVSVSQLQSFMSCSKKWEYGYVENLTPRVERPYLSIGKLCHTGMQMCMQKVWEAQQREDSCPCAWVMEDIVNYSVDAMTAEWNHYMASNSFLAEEIPDQEKTLEDAIAVFTQAIEEFQPWKYRVLTLYKDGKPIPALELHFVVPCNGSKGLHGYIDAILQDTDTGFTWCTDYKFRKSLSPDEEEANNVQNAVYTYACNKMGIPITGTMTWQHVNTPAATPSINKNGTISRAKIKTTWAKYAHFCATHGQDPEAYQAEMEPKLADNEFFRATYEYRNPQFVKSIWKDVIVPAAYAVKSARTKKNRRSLYPWNCKMCQYQSICQAEMRGYDADAIRQREYVIRHHSRVGNKQIDNPGQDVL